MENTLVDLDVKLRSDRVFDVKEIGNLPTNLEEMTEDVTTKEL